MSNAETFFILFLVVIAALGIQLLGKLVIRISARRSKQLKRRRT